ncbi:IclR family transcriptional regulator [Azospirillum sp. TSO35-2]|uniref:IclR family transcriptional regulator n=1 Tax=Azospirillum sp. TSO35-2 TaxID=716796 RepID=UPI000D621B7D|nr:IclR family transcriptional regulator [Azospirillum sp. TSO35-2]PWC36543.1 transcriptional regulator [Azospirillum sp. TSO35-2]
MSDTDSDPAADPANDTPDGGDRERRYSAPALEKGLDILEFLSERREPQTLQQIGDGVGRTKGEIFRMVSVLAQRGYIERSEGDDRFQVTDRLFRLGMNRPVNRSLIEIALPFMNAFAESTGYACHLAVMSGTQIAVVARVESTSHIGFSVRIGYRQPLVLTGSGHCLMAFMSARRRHRLYEELRRDDPWVDLDTLNRTLDSIRGAGHVARPSGITDAVVDLSSPIIDRREGGAVAALTCPYLRTRQTPREPEEILTALGEATRRISDILSLE